MGAEENPVHHGVPSRPDTRETRVHASCVPSTLPALSPFLAPWAGHRGGPLTGMQGPTRDVLGPPAQETGKQVSFPPGLRGGGIPWGPTPDIAGPTHLLSSLPC